MSLKIGEWEMNENGTVQPLSIEKVDPVTGGVTLVLAQLFFHGLWDETSRRLSFFGPLGTTNLEDKRFYQGLLFSTPRNPEIGQDVLWTLVGFVETPTLISAKVMGGNARRNIFGWFAQITEVA